MSLCNWTPGQQKNEKQGAFLWQLWPFTLLLECYITISLLNLMLMLCGLLQKDLCTGKWDLEENYLEQNYCHACHTRFAVFFPGSPALLHKFSIVYNSYQFWWHSSEKYKREKLPKREMEKRSTNGKNENVSSGEIILIIYLSFSNGYCKNIN